MLRHFLTLTVFFISYLPIFGQNSSLQNLLDNASKEVGQFVRVVPSNNLLLNFSDTTEYKNYLFEVYKKKVDTKDLVQIIQNSKTVDTLRWLDSEMPNSILVQDYLGIVAMNYVYMKFKVTDKKTKRKYKRIIHDFNNNYSDRKIWYISRPVFNDNKQFAVISISNNFEGGMLTLFKKIDDGWQEEGNINRWKF